MSQQTCAAEYATKTDVTAYATKQKCFVPSVMSVKNGVTEYATKNLVWQSMPLNTGMLPQTGVADYATKTAVAEYAT
jgi:hypothetical protein